MKYDAISGLNWATVTCAIWVQFSYPQVKRLLKNKRTHISVEVEVLDSEIDENGIEIIKKFSLLGFTILGQQYEEAIPGASLSVLEVIENALFQKKQKCLSFAYNSLQKMEKDNSNDVVENENPKEQINMKEDKKFNVEELSYENKRHLIEAKLKEGKDNDDIHAYVVDLTNSYAVFYYNGEYYRVNYKIENNEVNLDMETTVRVINSWDIYSEKEKENNMDKEQMSGPDVVENPEANGITVVMAKDDVHKEDESCENECKNTNACENKEEESCDNKETESCEDKQEESCDNNETESCEDKQEESCDNNETESCENKEEESCEDKQEESCENKETEACENECKNTNACDNKEEESCEDKATEACEDKESESCENKEEESCENKEQESCEDKQEESCEDKQDECNFVMVGNEKCNIMSLFEKFNALNSQYEDLLAKYQVKEKAEFVAFGNEIVDKETRIYESAKESIKNEIAEKCEKSEFSSKDDVKKFAISAIAMSLYEQNDSKQNFSVNIVNNRVNKNSSIEELKEANDKLKYI